MQALLFAGGAAKRLEQTGRMIPKPLLPMPLEPIINRMVDALLSCERPVCDHIHVVVPRTQELERFGGDPPRTTDLKAWFESWKRLWFADEGRVSILYEEDFSEEKIPPRLRGAAAAMYRIRGFAAQVADGDGVLLACPDNVFDTDAIHRFMATCTKTSDDVLQGYIERPWQDIQGRFGAVYVGPQGGRIRKFREKPRDGEATRKAAVALYRLPRQFFAHLDEVAAIAASRTIERAMVQQGVPPGAGSVTAHQLADVLSILDTRDAMVESHGQLVEALIATARTEPPFDPPPRAVAVTGQWFDIGTPDDYLKALRALLAEAP